MGANEAYLCSGEPAALAILFALAADSALDAVDFQNVDDVTLVQRQVVTWLDTACGYDYAGIPLCL